MSEDIVEVFRTAGAMKEGHFLLASGLHSRIYWEKFRVLQCPSVTQRLCGMISKHFANQRVETVAGPTTGGIIIAFEVARQLGIRSIYAERAGDVRVFRRDLHISPGERILVVDDVLTTGSSVRQTISAVEAQGGKPRELFAILGEPGGFVRGEPDFSSKGWVEEQIQWLP